MKHPSQRSCRVAANLFVIPSAGFGLALLLAASCDGGAVPAAQAPSNMPPAGDPDVPLPALVGPHACTATLGQLAIYQAVKAPLLGVNGAVVEPRNAAVIEGRQALFRAFLSLGAGAPGNVRGRLRLHSSQGVQVFNQEKNIAQDSTDSALDTSLNFTVPAAAIQGDTAVSLELDVGNSCPGGGVTRFPTGDPLPLRAQYTGVLKLTLVPVRYDADGSGRMPDVSEGQLARYHDALMAVYPVQEVQISVRQAVTTSISLAATGGWGSFLESVRMLRQSDGAGPDIFYYALVSPAVSFQSYCGRGSCTAGLSFLVGDSVAASTKQVGAGIGFVGALAAETLVHEIGHEHGRPHAPCGIEKQDSDQGFPYANGQIGVWGYDVFTQQFKPPIQVKDFMGYCNPQWISDYTFNYLANRSTTVQTRSRLVSSAAPVVSKYRTLLLEGEQGQPGGKREVAGQWGGLLAGPEQGAGTPEPAQVLDASGAIVAQVTVYRNAHGHGTSASLEVPEARTGWHALALAGGQVVRYSRSPTIPSLRPIELGVAPAGLPGELRLAPPR